MQVTETLSEGLKREYRVVVSADAIDQRIVERLQSLGQTTRIPGFRPGKVPISILRKRFGASVMGEVLEGAVNEGARQALAENELRPAGQPQVEVTSFDEGKDLEFTVALEILPPIEPVDFSTIELERLVAEVTDEAVEEALGRIAENRKQAEPIKDEKREARSGDVAVIDFEGFLDDKPFEGGKAEDYPLELGSGGFIPGFEDQVIGLKAGDTTTIKVTFPEEYGAEHLAGKEVAFTVTVKELREPVVPAVDDEFAKSMGMDSLDALRKAVREQIEQEYKAAARAHLKRRLLDVLSDSHDFEVPSGILDNEFEAIWKQVQEAREKGQLDEDEKDKSEDELRADYRALAERRVRLGLLLADVGAKNAVTVTQEDLNRALIAEARRFPGQEQAVLQYYQNNADAMNKLRAPIFEDKVVDFILEMVKVKERKVSPEELFKAPEEPDSEQGGGKAKPNKPKKKAAPKRSAKTAKKDDDAAGAAKKGGAKKGETGAG